MEKLKLEAFQLPLDPSLRISSPIVQKIFSSAQKPMWIKFKVDGSNDEYNAIFKVRTPFLFGVHTYTFTSEIVSTFTASSLIFTLVCLLYTFVSLF